MMRNKYYFLASDIELPRMAQAWIALGWLRRDLCGRGVGGESSVAVALAETTRAAGWLLARLRRIAARRTMNRAIRAT